MTTGFCAIDFGTSNSAIALPDGRDDVRLVALEDGRRTMPTAVFYEVEGLRAHDEPRQRYGHAAIAAYVEGHEGRLMRSMKSILGSTLATQSTDLGAGRSVRYLDVVTGFLRHLKSRAQDEAGAPLHRAVLGRPVFFVDDDAERDAAAQAALTQAAKAVGFTELTFQYEPIAAALHYEATVDAEQLVLVADIGGGTSDFSLVRVGPKRRHRVERHDDILANHGVHVAGTDFDRHVELAAILPSAGYRSLGPTGRVAPSKVYFDLATWHLINTVYAPRRVDELRRMKDFYADARHHARLMAIVEGHHGHGLAARAEAAKIASPTAAAHTSTWPRSSRGSRPRSTTHPCAPRSTPTSTASPARRPARSNWPGFRPRTSMRCTSPAARRASGSWVSASPGVCRRRGWCAATVSRASRKALACTRGGCSARADKPRGGARVEHHQSHPAPASLRLEGVGDGCAPSRLVQDR